MRLRVDMTAATHMKLITDIDVSLHNIVECGSSSNCVLGHIKSK